jgi:hypothetical protein
VLTQQLPAVGLEDANVEFVPLHVDQASDPAQGKSVVGRHDFDATVQMHDPLAVLVIAKRALKKRTSLNRDHYVSLSYCGEPAELVLTSAHSATLSIASSENRVSAASRACSRWRKSSALPAVEEACAAALEMGVHEYRFLRRYLERGPQLTLRQVDPLVRELVHYRDLINLRTQEPEK